MPSHSTTATLRFIVRSAQRLERLKEIDAPFVLLERERRVLLRRIEELPAAPPEVIAMVDEIEKMEDA